MIMSGWILPDMYEVKCESCSRVNNHLDIIKKYLCALKSRDSIHYTEIMHEFYRLRARRKITDLEDFAVVKLGWIKVINAPIRVVFYSPESPMELLVERYRRLNYTTISLDERFSIIHTSIPSNELI